MIDEVDGIGDRGTFSQQHEFRLYWLQIVNFVLEAITNLAPGVVLMANYKLSRRH